MGSQACMSVSFWLCLIDGTQRLTDRVLPWWTHRSLTINNVRFAGNLVVSVVTIAGLPFFQIDLPFLDGFTPLPGKTVRDMLHAATQSSYTLHLTSGQTSVHEKPKMSGAVEMP